MWISDDFINWCIIEKFSGCGSSYLFYQDRCHVSSRPALMSPHFPWCFPFSQEHLKKMNKQWQGKKLQRLTPSMFCSRNGKKGRIFSDRKQKVFTWTFIKNSQTDHLKRKLPADSKRNQSRRTLNAECYSLSKICRRSFQLENYNWAKGTGSIIRAVMQSWVRASWWPKHITTYWFLLCKASRL